MPEGDVSDREDPCLNKNRCDGRSDVRKRVDQKKDHRQADHGHDHVDPGIDMRFSANEQELHPKRIGADEEYGDKKKSQGQDGFRIVPAANDLDDRAREKINGRQADK